MPEPGTLRQNPLNKKRLTKKRFHDKLCKTDEEE